MSTESVSTFSSFINYDFKNVSDFLKRLEDLQKNIKNILNALQNFIKTFEGNNIY